MEVSEFFDVIDANRQPTGERKERGSLFEEGKFRQVVHVCLIDEGGRMLLQRRANDKATWPGKWDVSVGGSVIAGETSAQGGGARGERRARYRPGSGGAATGDEL